MDPTYAHYHDLLLADTIAELLALAKDAVWEPGRQHPQTYFKADILDQLPDAVLDAAPEDWHDHQHDAWLTHVPDGASISDHIDPPPRQNHDMHRFNVLLQGSAYGSGTFSIENRLVDWAEGDAVYFRPDRHMHGVGQVFARDRYVLSLGWLVRSLQES